MGGTTGCCVEKKFEATLSAQAQSITQLTRSHNTTKYQPISRKEDSHQFESIQTKCVSHNVNDDQNAVRKIPLADNDEEECKTESHRKEKAKQKRHKKRKIKNKLISPLRECIKEYNQSVEDNVLNMIGDRRQINVSAAMHMEQLDSSEICKYFKLNKYDIQWFLITPRDKFIIIIVSQWADISILTSITLYASLRMKIHKTTPSVTNSTLNLLNASKRKRNGKKCIEDITFTWKNRTKQIKQCDASQFAYVVSLIVKGENQAILKSNTLFKQSQIGQYKPLYAQKEILSYLVDVEMNGYLFNGITKDTFYRNIGKLVVDEHVQENEGFAEQYITNLYMKISEYDVTKIDKQQTCTIEFSVTNSKRWDSVSSLIKTMQVSDYSVDLDMDEDDDEYSESTSNTRGHNENTNPNELEQTTQTQNSTLQDSKAISQQMMLLQAQKDKMDTDQYIQKMETLQQKMSDSLQ
eukprot:155513_1